MRHKYETRGIVLSRVPAGEAHAHLALLTRDLGLVWARATGLRRSGGKLASSLVTFAESDLVLVRGREGWRITGAVLGVNWFARLTESEARMRAARVAGLVLRLAPGETPEAEPFFIMTGFFGALLDPSAPSREGAELLAVASLLSALGLDDEVVQPSSVEAIPAFSPARLAGVFGDREHYIARINRGIAASGL